MGEQLLVFTLHSSVPSQWALLNQAFPQEQRKTLDSSTFIRTFSKRHRFGSVPSLANCTANLPRPPVPHGVEPPGWV